MLNSGFNRQIWREEWDWLHGDSPKGLDFSLDAFKVMHRKEPGCSIEASFLKNVMDCFYSVPQVLGCCVFIFIRLYANFDFFFDFFCDLLVIQQRVVQPPYVGFFNSFSPVIEI